MNNGRSIDINAATAGDFVFFDNKLAKIIGIKTVQSHKKGFNKEFKVVIDLGNETLECLPEQLFAAV